MTPSASSSPTPEGPSLNAARRARELAEAREAVVDLLVVGLGATGAGVALDAASRGLSTVAIDAHDLAFGTSRWSSKMIHGGLRYLARGQVGVARESAVERGALLARTAPHLVRAQPYLLPLTPEVSSRRAAVLMAGYRLGDLLRRSAGTPRRLLPGPSRVPPGHARALFPALRAEGLRGALASFDGRVVDDARLVVAIARTAAAYGARVLTRCRALSLHGDGAEVRDELSGEVFAIRARRVVNAAGVWAGLLSPSVRLRPSRGTHLVLPAGALGGPRASLHVPMPGGGARFALVLPQSDGRVYVGLTDEPVDGPVPDVPEPPEADVALLLEVLNAVLATPVAREDVAGAYAGLRPLLDGGGRTTDLSRRHAVIAAPDGVLTVVGGKLTTYRRMAQDAVDAAFPGAPPSRTARLPLTGAPGGPRARAPEGSGANAVDDTWPHSAGTRIVPGFGGARTGPGAQAGPAGRAGGRVPARLVERYGTEAAEVHALALGDPALARTLPTGVTVAELVWAVRHEGALDAGDLLDRRTRVGLVPPDRAAALPAAERVLREHAP
ncbi:glycerol-3-phosphate dehydrogenase [Sphaerisporangium melleum]|uniref:Glycerol-3-phosphate dehydrogenase n=1 Tax=Sphaerisporangium melleum TaxID=321316 RepID=A0A917VEU1_9ACTN|nr:glycerol-3-phosphate dehydrogenase/oxidase [Sphaerisporangium melleum]GGK72101.1 glycerol-3-phosphate dehydrogenase [Sphaerisporangium melleum]GII68375.1 glycerol-3-phosphate dehydrogenase [Sphaerisporangium melleum]